MTISYNWLKEYIEISESPEELAEILTSTGLEVETIDTFEPIKGGLADIVVGEILTCEKHPNADKLSLTTVDVGASEPLQIVCGAPNVAQGQKVVVAKTGAVLYPTQGEPFVIKKTKIRGEKSEGMICAEDEIGLGESHAGIIILNTPQANGTPAAQLFDLTSDTIFEIGLTPNRADAMSHVGVARDIKAFTGRAIKLPSIEAFNVDDHTLDIAVKIENEESCPRYSAVCISGVTVAESPNWLKKYLLAIGLTPINNLVDITNFVCHELGQPLHAFDANHITGNEVIVKTLPGGHKFTTLDQKERTLLDSDLMICNKEEGMCIAGVFGGLHSGITEETTNVFLESAYFSAASVRKTAMHHQLKTDASFRFERGTDPDITVYALKRAALLIKEIAGGSISSDIIDLYPNKIPPTQIKVKDKNVNRLIGKVIPRDKAFTILENLDISIVEKDTEHYVVSVPPYRVDVLQEADIVEEILRIYGFNNLELGSYSSTSYLAEFPLKDIDKFKRTIGEMLTSNGFYEIWTNSLTNLSYQEKHNITFSGQPVDILNKLSEEQGILRQTMLFTGLEVSSHNINRKQKDLKLYEFGKIYSQEEGRYIEEERLALYMTGLQETANWQNKPQAVSYHDLIQHVQHILMKSGQGSIQQELLKNDALLEQGLLLKRGEREIGKLGKVKNVLLKDFGIKQDLFFAELSTSLLFRGANPKLAIQDVPKFPEVRRDLSLVIDKRVTFNDIQDLVRATEKWLVKNIIVFDVYEGDKIPNEKKAYAMGFTLLNEKKTLTDKEIDETMARLMSAFEQKLGAIIRK